MKNRLCVSLLIWLSCMIAGNNARGCDPPQILNVYCNNGTVLLNFQTSLYPELLGFNFYRNDTLIEFLPHSGDSVYTHYFLYQLPGNHEFCITSVCSLTYNDGLNETIESEPDCITVSCIYGFDLPFVENWDVPSFSANNWEISSSHWIILENQGNGPPSAAFEPGTTLVNYNETLTSYYINASAITEGYIYLEYDLKLETTDSSGTESFIVEIWSHRLQDYFIVKTYTNQNGPFGWIRDTLDISTYSKLSVINIRFSVNGENSSRIDSWCIDNILVDRQCSPAPFYLTSSLINDTCILLENVGNSLRELVDILIYVTKDGQLLEIYSSSYPIPNPYCTNQAGEYCFFLTAVWMSETDMCESDYTPPTCQQIIFSLTPEPNSLRFDLKPNPSRGMIRLETGIPIEKLEIYNPSGKLVRNTIIPLNAFHYEIYVSNPGFYLLKINTKDKIYYKKFIIL